MHSLYTLTLKLLICEFIKFTNPHAEPVCLSENVFYTCDKGTAQISCIFGSSFMLPSLSTAGISLDCQAQH